MKKKKGITSIINDMEVGRTASFPLEKLTTVRSTACVRGTVMGRKYVCNLNHQEGIIKVTREK